MGTVWHEDGRSASIGCDDLRGAATGMLEARRAMRGCLPASLVDDVPFEMLLALYARDPSGMEVDELLADQSVPAARARRWLDALVFEDLVTPPSRDVLLSNRGRDAMTELVTRVIASQRRLLGWADH